MDDIQTKIIYSYKKVSNFVFHYLIFFVALVIAILLFRKTTSSPVASSIQSNDTLLIQKTKLIAEFNKFLKQNISNHDLQIDILQGDLETEAWFIKSVNNLIRYRWFVAPKYFYIYSTTPIKNIEYFSWMTYDVNELENFVNAFVFTKKMGVNQLFTHAPLPLSKTLLDDFNLSCIFGNKISHRICDYYLNEFFDNFFIYNITSDYSGLKNIFYAIYTNLPQRERMCEWLSKYLLYANDQSTTLKELFGLCGQTYAELFKRTTLFIEIQQNLESQTFEKTSYKDILLNEYTLLSYQQQLYHDFLVNKVDTYKINAYLDFVRELLNKHAISQFYIDEIYWYNNRYLALWLEKLVYQSATFTQNIWSSKIASLIMTIATLNEWEPLLGFLWLNDAIHNKALIVQQDSASWSNITISLSEKIQKKLKNISYLNIEKQEIIGTNIDIIGYLKFISPNQNETIKTHIIMQYRNDMFLVNSIELQNKPEMNDVIKNLLLIQNFSIGELYSYLSKNLVFYEQQNIPITTNDLCSELKMIKNITITSCTISSTTIVQNNLSYTFTIKNGGIENITLSDKTLENFIKTSYSTVIWNSYSLLDTITAILAYTAPAQAHEGTTNAIVVFEKIQQYLWIKANDIADSSWKILVDISFGGINFIVNYLLKTNTMGPWYFKDIRSNGKPYPIQNLSLILDANHQNSINSFIIDPLTAIKTADLTARQNYNASQIKN